MTLRAVCYARVSSAAQRERDTIASQLRVLPAFIAAQGWALAAPAWTYVDDGHTAKAGHLGARTGLSALLRDAGLRLFDVVVVVDVDRLTRSEDLTERGAILGALQRAGVRIASATSGQVLDLSTSTGDLFTTLHAFFAAEWSRKHRERVTQGKLTAIARGRKPSGPTPYGLAYDRASGVWSVDPVTGPVVVELFERVVAGESCYALADDLEVRDVRRPRGRWTGSRVWQIVTSRHVVGTWGVDKRRGLTIEVPRMISDEMFQAAQDQLLRHKLRGLRKTRHVYLLEGIASCSVCGSPVQIRSSNVSRTRGGYRNPAAYVCRARKQRIVGAERCDAVCVPVADADARVWEAVCRELGAGDLVPRLIAARGQKDSERRDWRSDAAGYKAHLARLGKVEAAFMSRFRKGLISEAAMDIEMPLLERERAAVKLQLATAKRAAEAADSASGRLRGIHEVIEHLRAALAVATPAERRAIVHALVEPGSVRLVDMAVEFTMLIPLEVEATFRGGAAAGVAPALAVVPD